MQALVSDQYTIGEQLAIEASFQVDSGSYSDPTTVTFKIEAPDGTVTTWNKADLDHLDTGVYRLLYTPSQAGRYFVRQSTTGLPTVAIEGYIDVAVSAF